MATTERKKAPAFEGPASTGATLRLDDYRGKYLVLYFYPKSFTLGCTRETIKFRDSHDEIRSLGADIVGISPDPLETQCKFAEHYQARFPIIADEDGKIAREFGVMRSLIKFVRRETFVIDPEGYIVARFHHEVFVDKHVDDVIAFLRSRSSGSSN